MTTQALISGDPSCARTTLRAERDLQARRARCDCGGPDDEGAAIDLRSLGDHGLSPLCLRRSVDRFTDLLETYRTRQMFVIDASISASVGLGWSFRSAATAMIMPAWQ